MADTEAAGTLDRSKLKVVDSSLRTENEHRLFGELLTDVNGLDRLRGLVFERKPVDVATFVTHKDYLNKPDFWPIWLKDLETFFNEEHYLGILRGSIGCGRSVGRVDMPER